MSVVERKSARAPPHSTQNQSFEIEREQKGEKTTTTMPTMKWAKKRAEDLRENGNNRMRKKRSIIQTDKDVNVRLWRWILNYSVGSYCCWSIALHLHVCVCVFVSLRWRWTTIPANNGILLFYFILFFSVQFLLLACTSTPLTSSFFIDDTIGAKRSTRPRRTTCECCNAKFQWICNIVIAKVNNLTFTDNFKASEFWLMKANFRAKICRGFFFLATAVEIDIREDI